MDKVIAIIGAIIMGCFAALQQIANAKLGKLSSPAISSFQNFLVGTIAIFLIILFNKQFPTYISIFKLPWYLLFAGLFGISIVYLSIKVIPVIGQANMVSIMLSTWLILSLIIDNFGLLGVVKVQADANRLLGAIFLTGGILLITGTIKIIK